MYEKFAERSYRNGKQHSCKEAADKTAWVNYTKFRKIATDLWGYSSWISCVVEIDPDPFQDQAKRQNAPLGVWRMFEIT